MILSTSSNNLDRIKKFLSFRKWQENLRGGGSSFKKYYPPQELGLPDNFGFYLPIEQKSPQDIAITENAIQSIAEIYEFSPSEISTLLARDARVLAARLIGENTNNGSISLRTFDKFINEAKRLLLDSAAFSLNKSPRIERIPIEAENFLEKCRFLQTARGSFIASFEVPDFIVRQRDLYNEEEISSKNVTEKLFSTLKLVTEVVLTGQQDVCSEDFIVNNNNIISYEILRDIGSLIRESDSEEIEFSLKSLENVLKTSTKSITDDKLQKMDKFINFVKNNTSPEFEIKAHGHVVELRSSNPSQDRNYVLVRRSDDRSQDLAMYLTSEQYVEATHAHTSKRFVHISGMATQLRTKCSMTKISQFRVVRPT